MRKSLRGKLSLSRETVRGLEDLGQQDLPRVAAGGTENTCFQTCNCRSAYTCYWSECGCPSSGC